MQESYNTEYQSLKSDYWWVDGRKGLIESLLKKTNLPKNSKILDVGCGSGHSSSISKEYGGYFGLDVSPKNLKMNELAKYKIVGDANNIPITACNFDLVLCLDILEHLNDDVGSIKESLRVLKEGGYLIITIPAFQFIWSSHDIINRHKRRYNRESLSSITEGNSISLEFFSYWNFFLFVPAVILKIIKRTKDGDRNKLASDFKKVPSAINILFSKILKLENKIIESNGSFPFGTSIVAVLKKEHNRDG